MQLKNRIFFSIAYYLCKSSHFRDFLQNICAIRPCFSGFSRLWPARHSAQKRPFWQRNDPPLALLFCLFELSDAFLNQFASFFYSPSRFSRKWSRFFDATVTGSLRKTEGFAGNVVRHRVLSSPCPSVPPSPAFTSSGEARSQIKGNNVTLPL